MAHGPHPEKSHDIDEPDPTDLHEPVRELVRPPNEHIGSSARDLHDVIRHQPVPSLDQVQHALALPDAGLSDEQQPHPVDVRQ